MARRNSKQQVRLRGVVSLMNHAREQLKAGIPIEEQPAFRDMVTQGIRAIESFCRQQRGKPERVLPTPSYKAYQFLKSIDLNKLPVPQNTDDTPYAPPRISGIVSKSNHYHQQFTDMMPKWSGANSPDAQEALMQPLLQRLRSDVDAIAALCAETAALPANLSKPSRRAFQWMALLSDPAFLAMHLDTLDTLYTAVNQRSTVKSRSARRSTQPVKFRLYNTSVAFSKKQNGEVLLNEGYITAPESVLQALARIATGTPSKADMDRCKAFTKEQDFQEIHGDLELTTPVSTRAAKGRIYDLVEVFERVNAAYFDGEIACPNLIWSDTHTYRKMGHYNYTGDTVLISLSLDDAQVPQFYIDYVMYHELLHKQLGVRVVNGRRYAHTPEFKRREQEYPHWERVQNYIKQRAREQQ